MAAAKLCRSRRKVFLNGVNEVDPALALTICPVSSSIAYHKNWNGHEADFGIAIAGLVYPIFNVHDMSAPFKVSRLLDTAAPLHNAVVKRPPEALIRLTNDEHLRSAVVEMLTN